MATQQDSGGVPFAVAHELQQFRLLELPPELVELLEAPSPPLLSIKSQAPSTAPGATDPKAAYAVLCTPNKTYQLRQVQTSNSLFVAQPALQSHGNEIPVPATCAIASCTATLELHPSDGSAVPHLEQLLPVYDTIGGEVDALENKTSRAGIFSNIPLSDAECQKAWTELVAFELAGSSYRPSANTLAQVWQSIHAAALAEGIKLDEQFLTNDMSNLVEEEGYPAPLATSLLNHLSNADQEPLEQWSSLDRRKTVQFVGLTLLEVKRGGKDYLTADFLDTWAEGLPESWRADAALVTISNLYDLPSSTTISAKSKTPSSTSTTAPKSVASRKWHEKFAKTRKK